MNDDKELQACECGDDGCGCGCEGHDHEEQIMTLTFEDGKESECAVIATFPVEDKDYIALLPLENQEEGEVYLYGFKENEDDTFELLNIESDEEYEKVTKVFDEILDEAEMDELLEDE